VALLNIGRAWNDRQSGSERKRLGGNVGAWGERVGVGAYRRIDGSAVSGRSGAQSGSADRPYADTFPPRRYVPPTPTRFPSLRRNSPARLLDLRSVFFRFSDFAPERPRPLGIAAPFLFARRPALGGLPFPCFFDQCDEPINRQLAVPILRTRLLDCHRHPRRQMKQGDSGRDFVDMLATRSARAGKNLLELVSAQSETTHSRG
jgi:hypothetical protein